MLHIDDPLRLDGYRRWLGGAPSESFDDAQRIAMSLVATIWQGEMPESLDTALTVLQAHPTVMNELLELLDILEAEATHLTHPLANGIPLSVHARHSLIDVFAAIGRITPGQFYQHREGVYYDEATNTDLFFVTLKKSDREYSKSTLYKDYAISPTLFHWESQSTTTINSRTGQRYIHHRDRGGQILLFVRQQKKLDGQTMPYTLLGPAEYVSHQNERPIQFTLRLQRPMPADFFRQAKVAAG